MTWGLHIPVIAPCAKLQNDGRAKGSSPMPWRKSYFLWPAPDYTEIKPEARFCEISMFNYNIIITMSHKRTQTLQPTHPSSEFQARKRLKIPERRQNHNLSEESKNFNLKGYWRLQVKIHLLVMGTRGPWEKKGPGDASKHYEYVFHPRVFCYLLLFYMGTGYCLCKQAQIPGFKADALGRRVR